MKAKHYKIQELVSEKIFHTYGQKAWWFIDTTLIRTLDTIREMSNNPVTVNNWVFGGDNEHRGLREPGVDIGAYMSLHKLGKAADINIKGFTDKEVYNFIFKNIGKLPYIKGIQLGDGYVHIDVRNRYDITIF